MVVEQKFKVLRKAEKQIYQIMNSNLRKIEKNFADFRSLAEKKFPCLSFHSLSAQIILDHGFVQLPPVPGEYFPGGAGRGVAAVDRASHAGVELYVTVLHNPHTHRTHRYCNE